MTEPVREGGADVYGTHFLSLELPNLTFKCLADDGGPDINIGKENLHKLLQTTIDIASGTDERNWTGLIVLHACLQRWARYAKAGIEAFERDFSDVWKPDEP